MTAREIKVAVTLIDLAGAAGNQTFGLPSPSAQQSSYQDVVDAVNAAGGVACRKLVAQFYDVNTADQGDMQQKCLDIIQSGAFAVLDAGGESLNPACFGQNHIPYFMNQNVLSGRQVKEFYPYLFAPFTILDTLYRNTAFALRDRGYFKAANGFRKLGLVYLDCFPDTITELTNWLHEAGVPGSQIVSYSMGCPSPPIAAPSAMEQAILTFSQDGVTNVIPADFDGSFADFTSIAEQQGFKPKYAIPDDAILSATSHANQHPDFNNLAGAIAVTAGRFGEESTPGYIPTAATAKCNSIFASHGQPSLYQQGSSGAWVGVYCDQVWMLKAATEHAPALSREELAAGLRATKSIDFAFPFGPNDFSSPQVTYGGQFWRFDGFVTRCDCWQVIDATFHPSYP